MLLKRNRAKTNKACVFFLRYLLGTLVTFASFHAIAPSFAFAADDEKGKGLINCWVFSPERIQGLEVKDEAGTRNASILGDKRMADGVDALVLDGRSCSVKVSGSATPEGLPERAITVEAWVLIDEPVEWGGIAGFIQDNGDFEKGWLLGSRDTHLCFALSTKGADDGNGALTYLAARTEIVPGWWYHVAGTYDGAEQNIYVNGRLENSSTAQSGDILYPDRSFFDLAAYHDDNEHYLFRGMLHEVRLYNRCLSREEVSANFGAKKDIFPRPLEFVEGPDVRQTGPGVVLVSWSTREPGRCAVVYGKSMRPSMRVEAGGASANATGHEVSLHGIEPERSYYFRIELTGAHGKKTTSRIHTFEAVLSRSPVSYPEGPPPFADDGNAPLYEEAARCIVEQSGMRKGFCLILGSGRGRLAWELAKRTELEIIGVEPDPKKAGLARAALDEAGIYGTRVTIFNRPLDDLPFPDCFANLVVSDDVLTSNRVRASAGEAYRVLRPCGGMVMIGQSPGFAAQSSLGSSLLRAWIRRAPSTEGRVIEENGVWAVLRRGPLAGAGEWTHMLADGSNTACSKDELAHGPMRLQWFGRPGPRLMIDRHHRNVPPLYKDGRLFVPADDRVIVLDAYNGTWLWDVAIPGSRRLGVFLDSSNMVVDEKHLYVVHHDMCDTFDVVTGASSITFRMPQLMEKMSCDWSYVARECELLIGTGRIPGSSYNKTSYDADAALWYDDMSIVTSKYLFAMDCRTGDVQWSCRSGVLLNTTLTLGNGRVYFVESQSPKAVSDTLGRMPQRTFLEEGANFLKAIDMTTGDVLYSVKIDLSHCRLITYLSYEQEMLLLSGCEYRKDKLWYFFYGIDAATGVLKWERSHNTGFDPGGGHGEQNRHPTLVNGTVYTYPFAYSLKTGKRVEGYEYSREGHGCGGVSASAGALFWRGGNPTMRDLGPGGVLRKINRVSRPGCWINIIPAGGLVLIPESSSGCTCAFPLQTSMTYLPQEK